jgi:hypothetical protein
MILEKMQYQVICNYRLNKFNGYDENMSLVLGDLYIIMLIYFISNYYGLNTSAILSIEVEYLQKRS